MHKPLHIGVSANTSSIGGLNRFARELTLAQRNIGINAYLYGDADKGDLFSYGIKAFNSKSNKVSNLISKSVQLRSIKNDFDILDIHFAQSGLPVIFSATPTIIHFHGPWYLESKSNGQSSTKVLMKKLYETLYYKSNFQFVTLSNAFADVLITNFGIKAKYIEVIPPGINMPEVVSSTTRLLAFRHKFNLEVHEPFLISVRRLVPRMGLENLIDAIANLSNPIKLLIIGDGPLKLDLEKKIYQLGLGNLVKLTGKISDHELQTAYSAASASILPTISLEGFGLSALESMAYGTPVIATRSGGLAELMAGLPKEFCVEPGSTQELRDAIQLFLNQDYDFASVVRDHAALYNWEKVVIRTNECYAKAIEM